MKTYRSATNKQTTRVLYLALFVLLTAAAFLCAPCERVYADVSTLSKTGFGNVPATGITVEGIDWSRASLTQKASGWALTQFPTGATQVTYKAGVHIAGQLSQEVVVTDPFTLRFADVGYDYAGSRVDMELRATHYTYMFGANESLTANRGVLALGSTSTRKGLNFRAGYIDASDVVQYTGFPCTRLAFFLSFYKTGTNTAATGTYQIRLNDLDVAGPPGFAPAFTEGMAFGSGWAATAYVTADTILSLSGNKVYGGAAVEAGSTRGTVAVASTKSTNLRCIWSGKGCGTTWTSAYFDPSSGVQTITGTKAIGNVLTNTSTQVSGLLARKYQWSRSSTANGTYTNIPGATNTTYTAVKADAGKYLKCTMTGTQSGQTYSSTSPPFGFLAYTVSVTVPTRIALTVDADGSIQAPPAQTMKNTGNVDIKLSNIGIGLVNPAYPASSWSAKAGGTPLWTGSATSGGGATATTGAAAFLPGGTYSVNWTVSPLTSAFQDLLTEQPRDYARIVYTFQEVL